MAKTRSIQLDTAGTAARQIDKRTGEKYGETVNAIALQSLDRYFATLAQARRNLIKTFNEAELKLILDSCNGVWFEPVEISLQGFWINIQDSITLDGLDEKWNVPAIGLLEKLTALGAGEVMALIDFIEYFWANHEELGFEPHKILREM